MTKNLSKPSAELIARFTAIVGEANALTGESDTATYVE